MLREAGLTVLEGVLTAEAEADMGPHVWQPGEADTAKVGD